MNKDQKIGLLGALLLCLSLGLLQRCPVDQLKSLIVAVASAVWGS